MHLTVSRTVDRHRTDWGYASRRLAMLVGLYHGVGMLIAEHQHRIGISQNVRDSVAFTFEQHLSPDTGAQLFKANVRCGHGNTSRVADFD